MPELKLIRELPNTLNPRAIEDAICSFCNEVDIKGDQLGFVRQTLERIASATYLRTPGEDFWLAEEGGQVAGYVLARVVRDIDNSLCYWVSQAWVSPKFRGLPVVKESVEKLRSQARFYLCRHFVIVSARNSEAYCRWLRQGTHEYAVLLKQDLGELNYGTAPNK